LIEIVHLQYTGKNTSSRKSNTKHTPITVAKHTYTHTEIDDASIVLLAKYTNKTYT